MKYGMSVIAVISVITFNNINADPILLGGYHGANDIALQSPAASNLVTVTLMRTGPDPSLQDGSQIVETTWGTNTLDVVAPDQSPWPGKTILQAGVVDVNDDPMPFTLVLSVTNISQYTVILNQIHYWLKKDIDNEGPNTATLTYTSGSLDDTDGTSTNLTILNRTNPYDHSLGTFLSDVTLTAGESATFTWSHGPAQNPAGNTGIRMDNFAISGELIPPPAGTVLIIH
jgi:hypothetical protein